MIAAQKWMFAACLALPAAVAASSSPARSPDDLVFEGGQDGIALTQLIDTARDVTGEPFFFEPRDVAEVKVHFLGRVVLPRDRFLPFFDLCLREEDFVHLDRVVGGKTVHSIRKLGQQARGQQALKTLARTVTLDELKAMADRYTLVTTTYISKSLPARELVTTLQLYFADSATESIRNVEGTNAILMTGFSANLAAVVAMADRLDTAVAGSEEIVTERELEKRVAALEKRVAQLAEAAAKPAGK